MAVEKRKITGTKWLGKKTEENCEEYKQARKNSTGCQRNIESETIVDCGNAMYVQAKGVIFYNKHQQY